MGLTDKVLDALSNVIKMNDRIVMLSDAAKEQQQRIEKLRDKVFEQQKEIAEIKGTLKALIALNSQR